MTSTAALVARLLVASAMAMLVGCDRQPDGDRWPFPEDPTAAASTGELATHDGERLDPAQRRQAADLTALVEQYYPVWDPEHETMNAYHERYMGSPELARLHALIRQQANDNPAWQACLREIHSALWPRLTVRDGNPPGFYIPSFQIVIVGKHPRGVLTIVFRLSMLAPVYDYYERFRDPDTRTIETSLTPTRDTARLVTQIRRIIARHFPDHRELSPDVGAMRVPNIKVETQLLGEVSLADALFEDGRRWW